MAKKKNEPYFTMAHEIRITFNLDGEPRMQLYHGGEPRLPLDSDFEEMSKVLGQMKDEIDNRPCRGMSI